MDMDMRKRLAAAVLALCLLAGDCLTAAATMEGTHLPRLSVGQSGEAAVAADTGKDQEPAATSDSSGGSGITLEKPNTAITVKPSDKNALVMRDAGAESPKGVPGQTVDIIYTIAVNREYLPSEKYILRNITIRLDIPQSATTENWPFDIMDAASTKHLNDMSYNSIADVWYTMRISQFAKKGVYSVPCIVNATIWRQDIVNGTEITEDVEFPLNTFVTVVEDGDLSGVTSAVGPLEIAGRRDSATSCATGSPGSTVTLRVPIKNKGRRLSNVTVSLVVDGDVEKFPFVASNSSYGRELGSMENGDERSVDWTLTISPYATTGNKVVKIRGTYEENGVYGECTLDAYIYVENGYVKESAPSLMVERYRLYVDGEEVKKLEAGRDAALKVTLKNNAANDTVYKTVASLSLADPNSLVLTPGCADMAYVRSIPPGGTAEVEYSITARTSAAVGPSAASLSLSYEIYGKQDVVPGKAVANIRIPVKQAMKLQFDTPVLYGTPAQGEPLAVSLNMTNLGRSRAYNVRIAAMNGISIQNPYYGGDILAAGSLNADVQVIPNKSGAYTGTLVVQYEDADGEEYSQKVPLNMEVAAPMEGDTQEEDAAPQKNPSRTPGWIILLVILLLGIGGFVGWFVYNRRKRRQDGIGSL